MNSHRKILGVDFGTKRIGLAVSYGHLAEPLLILTHDERAFDRLKQICKQEQITEVVVGLSENKTAERTQVFVAQLVKNLELPVAVFDETLSTQSARNKLKNPSTKKSKQHLPLDHYAAAEILQEYLDTQVG